MTRTEAIAVITGKLAVLDDERVLEVADIVICAYHVTGTPFIVPLRDDDAELRVDLVILASTDRTQVDLSSVVW